jgi:hypothetical protein
VRSLIHSLLVRIGREHPQALMYPLLVACKSQSPSRRAAAYSVLGVVRQQYPVLVDQAELVSQELIRIAILWQVRVCQCMVPALPHCWCRVQSGSGRVGCWGLLEHQWQAIAWQTSWIETISSGLAVSN